MALLRCQECSTLFAVGAEQCPQCESKKFHEEGSEPPKKKTTRRKSSS